MIKRTERLKRRTVGLHHETVMIVTYWLFGVIPIYSTEEILRSTLMRG